jgi:hypothetical protein
MIVRQYGIGGRVPFAYHRTPGFGDCNWTAMSSAICANSVITGSPSISKAGTTRSIAAELEMTGQVYASKLSQVVPRRRIHIQNPT